MDNTLKENLAVVGSIIMISVITVALLMVTPNFIWKLLPDIVLQFAYVTILAAFASGVTAYHPSKLLRWAKKN